MNKKGITIIELIISVALISVVMLYLFNLLSDMQYESNHSSYAKSTLVNRATIIKNIETDFLEKKLASASLNNSTITLTWEDGTTSTIVVTQDSLSYTSDSDYEKWLIEDDNYYYDIDNITITTSPTNLCQNVTTGSLTYEVCPDYKYIHIKIPVNDTCSNLIDDIDLFYIGEA